MADGTIAPAMKACTKCGEAKPATAEFFYRDRARLTAACRECALARILAFRQAHPEKHRAAGKAWRDKNPEAVAARNKAYREANPELHRARCAEWQANNLERHRKNARDHYQANREAALAARKANQARNRITAAARRERIREIIRAQKRAAYASDPAGAAKRRDWRNRNLESARAVQRAYQVKRYAADPAYVLRQCVSTAVRHCLTRAGASKRRRRWESLLGFELAELRRHLERQFSRGMTWENYGAGGWHIDHIIPLASFAITSADCPEFRAAWALPNLRPLWATDNMRKGAKRLTLL